MECKQRGALMRQGGRQLRISDSRSFFPGNVVDKVVREWLSGDPDRNPGMMPEMVPLVIDREVARIKERGGLMKWRSEEDRASVEADCIEAVTRIEPALAREVLPHDYAVDWRFEVPLGIPYLDDSLEYITLTGVIDIIVRTKEGKTRIWDVKMTRDDQYWRKTVGQLSFYDLAVFAMFEEETELVGLLQPMCSQEVFPYELDDTRRAMIMGQVLEMCHDVWRGDDEPTSNAAACFGCSVKHACSKFKPVVGPGRRVELI